MVNHQTGQANVLDNLADTTNSKAANKKTKSTAEKALGYAAKGLGMAGKAAVVFEGASLAYDIFSMIQDDQRQKEIEKALKLLPDRWTDFDFDALRRTLANVAEFLQTPLSDGTRACIMMGQAMDTDQADSATLQTHSSSGQLPSFGGAGC